MSKILKVKNCKDCLKCEMREVIIDHSENKSYQRCRALNEGYKLEKVFKAKDLKDGFISKYCPLEENKEYERIKEIVYEILNSMNVTENGFNVLIYSNNNKYKNIYAKEIAENEALLHTLYIIKKYYNIKAILNIPNFDEKFILEYRKDDDSNAN